MTDANQPARTPRYARISNVIRSEIASGHYTVGGMLPSVAELCRRFQVSRFTVREALSGLQADGMVSSIQGAGSRVLRDTPARVFIQNYRSVSELTQFAEETRLELITSEETILDTVVADRIGGAKGEVWFLMRGVRRAATGEPLALVESYVPRHFASIACDLALGAGPIYAGLANAANESVERAELETQALPAPRHVADVLGIAAGAPTLCILRRYFSRSGLLIASYNWHQGGDRYIHRTQIELDED
jgi:GntR family transcriptional regulator